MAKKNNNTQYFHGPCQKKKLSATTVNNEGIQIEFKDEN